MWQLPDYVALEYDSLLDAIAHGSQNAVAIAAEKLLKVKNVGVASGPKTPEEVQIALLNEIKTLNQRMSALEYDNSVSSPFFLFLFLFCKVIPC